MSQELNAGRVFIVDDELIIASTLATILQRNGYDATSFNKPVNALEAARAKAPDLIISDVVMPVLSGIELAIQVRSFCPACKILLFSGQTSTENLLRDAQNSGHNFELLSKPIPPTEFLKHIKNVIAEK